MSEARETPPGTRAGRGRLLVFSDYPYRIDPESGAVSAEMPFAVFVQRLGQEFDALTVTGRLDPQPGRFAYPLLDTRFVALPFYRRGSNLVSVLGALPAGVRTFWRALGEADVVWVIGPHPPQAIVFALLARLRGRAVALGVRQQLRQLIRHRHPGRLSMRLVADVLELAFRLLGRIVPVVAVGPHIAEQYRHSRGVHVTYVSLLSERDLRDAPAPADWEAPELRLLSVGRLDPEKNPLLLVDVMREALARDPRWRLDICGEGSLEAELRSRVAAAGLQEQIHVLGNVAFGDGLWARYRSSHALLHVSHTEGVPQVLLEAFAARLPVVATAVGGVPGLVQGRGLLVAPGDPVAAAEALTALIRDPAGREARVSEAAAEVARHTVEAESRSLAAFLSDGVRG